MQKKLTLITALALALGLIVTGCPGLSTNSGGPINGGSPGPPEVGKLAPDFELNTLDRQTIVLSQLRGTPVLLNFWATWCGPCRHEMPFLQQLYLDWPTDELALITVNVAEDSSDVSRFMQEQGLSFPVLLDGQAALFAAIVARHPDCLDLVEAYMTGVEDGAPEKVEA